MTTRDAATTDVLAILRGLPEGALLWLPARGSSLWPLVPKESWVRVRRGSTVRFGDVAVVRFGQRLVAHPVVRRRPLATAALLGVRDPPPDEVFGHVVAFRRGQRTVHLHEWSRPFLGSLPGSFGALRWAKRKVYGFLPSAAFLLSSAFLAASAA